MTPQNTKIDMNGKPLIHIVVPMYNEGKAITGSVVTLVEFLKNSIFSYPYIITLVNNASTDDTLIVSNELAKRFTNVQVLDLPQKGKARAIRAAWSMGVGDVVVFMDVDLASDLNYLRALVDAIVISDYDMAIGNRLGKKSKVISRKFLRKFASYVYNILVRLMFGTKIQDHQCGFKAMKRKSYMLVEPMLVDTAWFFDTEVIVWARKKGLTIAEIDIVWTDGKDSKVSLFKTSWDLFTAMLALKRRVISANHFGHFSS